MSSRRRAIWPSLPTCSRAWRPNGGRTKDIAATGVGAAIGKLPPDQITADLNAVADYVKKLPGLQREGLRGGLLVGRRAIVPLRHQPQGPLGGIRVLRHRPGGGGHPQHPGPRLRFLRGRRCARRRHRSGHPGADESGGQVLRAVTYEGAAHGFMRAGAQPDATEAQSEGARRGMGQAEGAPRQGHVRNAAPGSRQTTKTDRLSH